MDPVGLLAHLVLQSIDLVFRHGRGCFVGSDLQAQLPDVLDGRHDPRGEMDPMAPGDEGGGDAALERFDGLLQEQMVGWRGAGNGREIAVVVERHRCCVCGEV